MDIVLKEAPAGTTHLIVLSSQTVRHKKFKFQIDFVIKHMITFYLY